MLFITKKVSKIVLSGVIILLGSLVFSSYSSADPLPNYMLNMSNMKRYALIIDTKSDWTTIEILDSSIYFLSDGMVVQGDDGVDLKIGRIIISEKEIKIFRDRNTRSKVILIYDILCPKNVAFVNLRIGHGDCGGTSVLCRNAIVTNNKKTGDGQNRIDYKLPLIEN